MLSRTRGLVVLVAALAALSGCAPRSRLHDTKTIHDAAATKIWIIEELDGEQHVVLCDIAMLQQARTLCMRANITQAPVGPVMTGPRGEVPALPPSPAPPPAPAALRAAAK